MPVPAQYAVLEIALPGRDTAGAGVLLEDIGAGSLHLRLRRDWGHMTADEDDLFLLELLAEDLADKARSNDLGSSGLMKYLHDSASNVIRITDPRPVAVEDFDHALNRLYRQYVPSHVLQFRTHLPFYSLRAAAGKFLENDEVSEVSWIETPGNLPLKPDMFVGRIVGHSMEPHIPDDSLCVFRAFSAGSRKGKLVLVEDRSSSGGDRYTVKRYDSGWADSGGLGQRGQQSWIRLHALNKEYGHLDLDPEEDRYAIVAEFIRVLE